jgi:hypothetical protein
MQLAAFTFAPYLLQSLVGPFSTNVSQLLQTVGTVFFAF